MLRNTDLKKHLESRPSSHYLTTSIKDKKIIISIDSDRGASLSESSPGLILFFVGIFVLLLAHGEIDTNSIPFILVLFAISFKRSLEPYLELIVIDQTSITHDLGKHLTSGSHRIRFPFYKRKIQSKIIQLSNLNIKDNKLTCDFNGRERNIARMLSDQDQLWIYECLIILIEHTKHSHT